MATVPGEIHSFRQTALIATLRKSRMFAELSSAEIDAVADGCSLRTLQKGEMLFREGERGEGFYVVQTGAISVYRLTPDGRECHEISRTGSTADAETIGREAGAAIRGKAGARFFDSWV